LIELKKKFDEGRLRYCAELTGESFELIRDAMADARLAVHQGVVQIEEDGSDH
jgi:hypothetical protein